MKYQLIGKITGFKGLKGQLKIKVLSGFLKERFEANSQIYIQINQDYQAFSVKSYNDKEKTPLLVLENYEDINLIQHLNKKNIYANADDDFLLEENAYHQDELIGLNVFQSNELKGQVVDIKNYPKDDYLLVRTKEKEVLIPFRDEFIISMDDEKIVVIDMEGLF